MKQISVLRGITATILLSMLLLPTSSVVMAGITPIDSPDAIELPEPSAIITITTSVEWDSNHNNTDGYIIRGCTLWIDAVNSVEGDGNIDIVFGGIAHGAGDFVVEDDARIVFNTSDSHKIYMGGWGLVGQANTLKVYGVIETNYQGSTSTRTTFIGQDEGANKTIDSSIIIYTQTRHIVENIFFLSDATWVMLPYCGGNLYYKHCTFGDGTEQACLGMSNTDIIWLDDCIFDATGQGVYTNNGGLVNEAGTNARNGGCSDLSATMLDIYNYWSRAYILIEDEASNPLEDVQISIIDGLNEYMWGGFTAADGKLDESESRFNLDYLLCLNQTVDDFYGTTIYSNDTLPANFTASKTGYDTAFYSLNMSTDWGSSGSFVTITLNATDVAPSLNYKTNTTWAGLSDSTMGMEGQLIFNGTYNTTSTITDLWINASVYDSATDTWQSTLIPTTAHSPQADIEYNLSTEFKSNLPIYINATDYALGEYYVKTVFNKSGTIENYTSYAEFSIVEPSIRAAFYTWDYLGEYLTNIGPEGLIYYNGEITLGHTLSNVAINSSVYDDCDNWVETLLVTTHSFTASINADLVADINGGVVIPFNSTGHVPAVYYVGTTVSKAGALTNHNYLSEFTINNATTYMNASAYDSNLISSNVTNRFNLSLVAYFNGTIRLSYNVTNASVNITIHNSTMYITTLFNGTYNFTENTNTSLTTIAGDVINYTCNIEGEFYLRVEVYKTNAINSTVITEGFNAVDLVRNTLAPGYGILYVDPCFFEWDLLEALTVQFTDRTKTKAATDIISYIWNFGDGNGGTGANPEHQYQMPGDYEVTMIAYYSDGSVESFTSTVRVVDNAVSWLMYIMVGVFVFIGLLVVGAYAVREKSKRLSTVMYIILGSFILISIVVMQAFIP